MPHISFKIKAESISTLGTNGLSLQKDFYSYSSKLWAYFRNGPDAAAFAGRST